MGGVLGALADGRLRDGGSQANYTRPALRATWTSYSHQVIAVCASMTYAFVVTFVLVKVIDMTIGMTVKDEEEYVGLDISQHGERAFT